MLRCACRIVARGCEQPWGIADDADGETPEIASVRGLRDCKIVAFAGNFRLFSRRLPKLFHWCYTVLHAQTAGLTGAPLGFGKWTVGANGLCDASWPVVELADFRFRGKRLLGQSPRGNINFTFAAH